MSTVVNKDEEYYVFNRGDSYKLGDPSYFSTREFTCQCSYPDCNEQKVSKELISKLNKVREEFNEPIVITSGYRCQKHQEALSAGGLETAKNSQHCLGNAADVRPVNMENKAELDEILDKEFMALGIANSFTHCDTRKDKKRRWGYIKS